MILFILYHMAVNMTNSSAIVANNLLVIDKYKVIDLTDFSISIICGCKFCWITS